MTEIVRGDGMKYALAYNEFHNFESIGIVGKNEPLIKYTYKNGNGRLKQMTYANGDTMKAIYNSTGQMTGEVWQDSSGVEIARYKYVYDGQGNIVRSIDIFAPKEYTYVHEEGRIGCATESAIILSGQLLTETVNGEVVNSIEYDNYGNITEKNGKVYTYDATWKDLLTSYDGKSITYDAQGNPTSYLGHTLTWEKGRQLKSFDGNTYTYNANGIRTSKTVNGVKHTYTLDGTKILREAWGENTLIPLYDNEESVCGILYNSVPYYFTKNLQGDIIAITAIVDEKAETVARYSYDAWGVPTITEDTSGCQIATINPFRYRGYYYDEEIELYYLQSRYYDAGVGRFVNSDTLEMIKLQIDTRFLIPHLLYYCYNDPINNTDETGYGAADVLLNAIETTFNIIVGVHDMAAINYTEKDIKKIRKATKKSRRQIEREIANAQKESKKLAKRFKIVSILLSIMSIILLIYTCASNASSIFRAITDCVVEMFIALLVCGACKVVDLLLNLVPVPGLGFVLGIAAGYLIEGIFSSWFDSRKKKRIQNKFYSSSLPLLNQKSTDITKYVNCFFKSLRA